MPPAYATLATFRAGPAHRELAVELLRSVIAPGVASSPGFVSGCWASDESGQLHRALVVLDSREAAEAFADAVRANDAGRGEVGMELESIEVLEVLHVLPEPAQA